MIEPEQGFGIDTRDYRWGTLPGDVAGIGSLPPASGYLHRSLACRSIFGFQAAGVSVSAPAPDRPVLGVTYELAAPFLSAIKPDRWLAPLQARLGAATSIDQQDLKGYRDPSSGVAYWAGWTRPTVAIGLSIYGGVRALPSGRSAGLIYLSWVDSITAAAPFVPAWRAACAALAETARSIGTLRCFDMPAPLRRASGALETDDGARIAASRALHNRTILATPDAIRDRIERHTLALWQGAPDGPWVVSSWCDSVVLRGVHVDWNEIQPAKGGGQSALSIGGWSVAMPYGTKAIAAAAAALKALPGVTVELYEGYDV